jgi:hypothetical protein
MDRVHVFVDQPGTLGPPWTDAGALTGARPPAAPVRQDSLAGAQNGEGGTGSSARASPELRRRRGDRAMAVARRGHGNSMRRGSSVGEAKRRAR